MLRLSFQNMEAPTWDRQIATRNDKDVPGAGKPCIGNATASAECQDSPVACCLFAEHWTSLYMFVSSQPCCMSAAYEGQDLSSGLQVGRLGRLGRHRSPLASDPNSSFAALYSQRTLSGSCSHLFNINCRLLQVLRRRREVKACRSEEYARAEQPCTVYSTALSTAQVSELRADQEYTGQGMPETQLRAPAALFPLPHV